MGLFRRIRRVLGGIAGTPINPGDDWQTIVNAASTGTTFIVKNGTHRHQSVSPKDGQKFIGESTAAIMSGAKVLTGATPSGGLWYYSTQTQGSSVSGIAICQVGYGRCGYVDDVFIDGTLRQHMTSLGAISTGYFYDYDADRIYISEDPAGKTVEVSVTTQAFKPTAVRVTIQNLIIEKYACPAQVGAVDCSTGWVVENNEIRLNHGMGLRPRTDCVIKDNLIHHNGQMGLGGGGGFQSSSNLTADAIYNAANQGHDILIEGNEIAYNNASNYDAGWEGGGTKFVNCNRLIVRSNWSHHNDGGGLWTDVDNSSVTFEDNTVEDNETQGIMHEIGFSCIIRNNEISRNGAGFNDYVYGAGILISESQDVEVYGNTLVNNNDGICVLYAVGRGGVPSSIGGKGVWIVNHVHVYDNDVQMIAVGSSCYVGAVGSASSMFTQSDITFSSNIYRLPSTGGGSSMFCFAWNNAARTFADWQTYGHDSTGTVVVYEVSGFTETFAGTPGVNLTTINAVTTWAKSTGWTADIVITDADSARGETDGALAAYYASTTPATANYTITANFTYKSGFVYYVWTRGRAASGDASCYAAVRDNFAGTWKITEFHANGTSVDLGSWAQALTNGQTYVITFEMIGTNLRLKVDGATQVDVTDSAITGVGLSGLGYYAEGAMSNTTGMHWDTMILADAVSGNTSNLMLLGVGM